MTEEGTCDEEPTQFFNRLRVGQVHIYLYNMAPKGPWIRFLTVFWSTPVMEVNVHPLLTVSAIINSRESSYIAFEPLDFTLSCDPYLREESPSNINYDPGKRLQMEHSYSVPGINRTCKSSVKRPIRNQRRFNIRVKNKLSVFPFESQICDRLSELFIASARLSINRDAICLFTVEGSRGCVYHFPVIALCQL